MKEFTRKIDEQNKMLDKKSSSDESVEDSANMNKAKTSSNRIELFSEARIR
jgi:hypothetical protein